MQLKLLKDIVSTLVGASSSRVVDLLYEKKNVNEFLIAKKLKLTINQTRNILYKLADEGLVSFVRKKDSKKGGWYTYFWTLNTGKSLSKFREKLLHDINHLKGQASLKKGSTFYFCPNCATEYTDENALLHEYTCPECGEILQLKNNTSEVVTMEKEVVKFETLLAEVNNEIDILGVAEEKVKHRRLKAEAKKKTLERQERKKEREKLAKKTDKGVVKKPAEKKKTKKVAKKKGTRSK